MISIILNRVKFTNLLIKPHHRVTKLTAKNWSSVFAFFVCCLLFLYFICSSLSFADNNWQKHPYSAVRIIQKNNQFSIQIKLDKNWKIYGPQQTDLGQPTKFNVTTSKNAQFNGVLWPKTHKDHTFNTQIYEGKMITFPLDIKVFQGDRIKIDIDYSYLLCSDLCLPMSGKLSKEFSLKHSTNPNINFAYILLISLLGGFILNFMPCVLPIVTLKAYKFINKRDHSKRHNQESLLAILMGILFTFLSFSLFTIIMKNTGKIVGFSLHFQEPLFIITLLIISVTFITNIQGYFELTLPSWITNQITKNLVSKSKLVGDFFTGIFFAIMATPCTAPFVTIAITYALTQSNAIIIIIFLTLGLGFGLPYLCLIINPNILKYMPKPGPWLKILKNIIAIMLSAMSVWLLYILSDHLSWQSIIVILLLCLIFKFILTIPTKRSWHTWIKFILIVIVVISCYRLPFILNHTNKLENKISNEFWKPLDVNNLSSLNYDNHLVLVDVTAKWCVTCQINKFFILDNEAIIERLKMYNVIALRADVTKEISREVYNLLQKHNRQGIPFNIVYGPNAKEGIVLPVVLTPSNFMEAIQQAKK